MSLGLHNQLTTYKRKRQLWTPSELGPSVQGWWDADDGETVYDSVVGGNRVTTNGGVVRRWEDKSGNGRSLTGSGSSVSLKINNRNGRNTIYSGPAGSGGGLANLNSSLGQGVTSLSIAVVYNAENSSGANSGPVKIAGNVGTRGRLSMFLDEPQIRNIAELHAASDDNVFSASRAISYSFGRSEYRSTLWTANYNSTSQALLISQNGTMASVATSLTGATSSGASASAYVVVGASDYINENFRRALNGNVAEVIITHTNLVGTTADRERVEGYLAHKWGIHSSLPLSHPYRFKPPYK